MFGLSRRALMGALVLGALGLAQPALADDGHPYFGPEALDLTVLLVPPPAERLRRRQGRAGRGEGAAGQRQRGPQAAGHRRWSRKGVMLLTAGLTVVLSLSLLVVITHWLGLAGHDAAHGLGLRRLRGGARHHGRHASRGRT